MAGSYPRLAVVTDLDGPFPCAQRAARQTITGGAGGDLDRDDRPARVRGLLHPHPGNPVGRPGHDTASSEWREVQS